MIHFHPHLRLRKLIQAFTRVHISERVPIYLAGRVKRSVYGERKKTGGGLHKVYMMSAHPELLKFRGNDLFSRLIIHNFSSFVREFMWLLWRLLFERCSPITTLMLAMESFNFAFHAALLVLLGTKNTLSG